MSLPTAAGASPPNAAGIWLSDESGHRLSEAYQEELLSSLKRITGLESLRLTSEGQLTLGEIPESEAGSKQARRILQWAMNSKHSFIIEDYSRSPTVHFGQLDEGLIYEDARNGLRMLIWRVRLDFADFRAMDAPQEVRKTFDSGFTLLHELLHGLGYKDTTRTEEIGECEKLVNEARSELGLPLRDQYFGDSYQLVRNTFFVRLRFRSKKPGQLAAGKTARDRFHYLIFPLPPSFDLPAGGGDDLHTESLMKANLKR